MSDTTFRAMVVEETPEHHFIRRITSKSVSDLPEGDVLIKVHYSSLNYKDALSASGNKGVTRKYPHTPGIDAAGVIVESKSHVFKPGQQVLVTGYDLGMNTSGGFGQYIRVPSQWVVPIPENLTLKESMIYGTAGFTAALCIQKLMGGGITPDSGDILVTGASGGVGSLAVATLAHLGYKVVAASGKSRAVDILKSLGAFKIIAREEITDKSDKPLLPQRWAGVIDTVGGDILYTSLRSTNRHGIVACCGNVASADLHLTVYPFILRGISLTGADSATSTMETRKMLWEKLAGPWKTDKVNLISSFIGLEDLDAGIESMLKGDHSGRSVVTITE